MKFQWNCEIVYIDVNCDLQFCDSTYNGNNQEHARKIIENNNKKFDHEKKERPSRASEKHDCDNYQQKQGTFEYLHGENFYCFDIVNHLAITPTETNPQNCHFFFYILSRDENHYLIEYLIEIWFSCISSGNLFELVDIFFNLIQ